MAKLNQPLFLKIETDEQLESLRTALQMQCEMQDDISLDETITSVQQFRQMNKLDDDLLRTALSSRRKAANLAIDQLLTTIEVQNNYNAMIDKVNGD